VDFGLFIFPAHFTMEPGALAYLAEDAGFESLHFPEHTHIPASRKTPFPGGEPLPPQYYGSFDPFVALTAAASATTRLKVGSGIVLAAQREPIATAKAVASLDVLSGGRLILGVGAGWNVEELENHGVPENLRWARLEDHVRAMQAIWTQDEATYHGRYVDFEAIWSWPKPVQKPHPPILLAGNGPRVLDRVLAYADGWCPLPSSDVPQRIAELRARAADAGREVSVTIHGLSTDAGRDEIEQWIDAGADRCTFHLPPAEPGEVERLVEGIRTRLEEQALLA
jgi:probable F420-dependent oxidoreductase